MSYEPNKEMLEEIGAGSIIGIKACLVGIIFSDRTLSKFEQAVEYIIDEKKVGRKIELIENYDEKPLVKPGRNYNESDIEDFKQAIILLKNNFCKERIDELKSIANTVYPREEIIKKNNACQESNKVTEKKRMMKTIIMILGVIITIVAIVKFIKKI